MSVGVNFIEDRFDIDNIILQLNNNSTTFRQLSVLSNYVRVIFLIYFEFVISYINIILHMGKPWHGWNVFAELNEDIVVLL